MRRRLAHDIPDWIFVALGGALGTLARGGLDALAQAAPWSGPVASFLLVAWSTVLVDLGGAFFLGALSAFLARRAAPSPGLVRLRLFAATGFAGAFTTYGTLIGATGTAMLDRAGRADVLGIFGAAAGSLLLLVIGVAAAGAGWLLVRSRGAAERRSEENAEAAKDRSGRPHGKETDR